MKHCKGCGKLLVTVSWSSLQTFLDCPAKVKLRRQHKNPTRDIRNFFGGTIVDVAMRNWLKDFPESNPGGMLSQLEKIADEEEIRAKEKGDGQVKWRNKSDRQDMLETSAELVKRLEPILHELVLPYEYQPAYRFRVPISVPKFGGEPAEITLIGEMDLLTRDDEGNFSIWDLKATKDNSYWRKTWPQLVFYDLAIRAGFRSEVKETGLIQPMCNEQVLRFDITDSDRIALMTKIAAMADALWEEDFPPKASNSGCSICECRHACPKWQSVGDLVSRKMTLQEMAQANSQLALDEL